MTTLTPDTVVGHHILEEKLGEGGFGEVWRARRQPDAPPPEHPDEPAVVAVKIARDPARARTLSKEASLLEKLAHPGIVRIFDVNADHDMPHLVMELVEGRDLATILDERDHRRLAPPLALRLGRQVAESLAYAHAEGVIHGDIKPLNLLMRHDGGVVMSDFGLGRVAPNQSASLVSPSLHLSEEATTSITGTLAYLAPECKRGEAATKTSDVYSLGAMIFEMLVGRLPRGAWRPLARLLASGREEEPGLLVLDKLLRATLDPSPERRPESMAELAEALGALEAGLSADEATELAPLRLCPVDGETLHTTSAGGSILDRCRRCGGTWFDTGEFEEVLRDLSLDLPETVTWQPTPATPDAGAATLTCPICQQAMQAVSLKGAAKVYDFGEPAVGSRCLVHGLWLPARSKATLLDPDQRTAVSEAELAIHRSRSRQATMDGLITSQEPQVTLQADKLGFLTWVVVTFPITFLLLPLPAGGYLALGLLALMIGGPFLIKRSHAWESLVTSIMRWKKREWLKSQDRAAQTRPIVAALRSLLLNFCGIAFPLALMIQCLATLANMSASSPSRALGQPPASWFGLGHYVCYLGVVASAVGVFLWFWGMTLNSRWSHEIKMLSPPESKAPDGSFDRKVKKWVHQLETGRRSNIRDAVVARHGRYLWILWWILSPIVVAQLMMGLEALLQFKVKGGGTPAACGFCSGTLILACLPALFPQSVWQRWSRMFDG